MLPNLSLGGGDLGRGRSRKDEKLHAEKRSVDRTLLPAAASHALKNDRGPESFDMHHDKDHLRPYDASLRPSGAADPRSAAGRRDMPLSASAGDAHKMGALRIKFVALITEGDS